MFETLRIGGSANNGMNESFSCGSFQPLDFGAGLPFGGEPPGNDFGGYSGPLQTFPTRPPTETKLSPEEQEKRNRAKRASRIYRKICSDAGLSECFFTDFSTWSEFVEGKMNEGEFSRIAESVAKEMVSEIAKAREASTRN